MMMSLITAFVASRGWIASGYTAISASAVVASVLLALWLLPIVFCFIGNRSRGALDNASGVAAVLIAAERANAGVLITSGEELGLAGARAFVSARDTKAIALNCDTIDDNGRFLAMTYGMSAKSTSALAGAATKLGVSLTKRRMIPGILADNVAFSAAGWDSCTLAKGNLTTLAFVHTSGDRNTSIRGTGIAQAAELLVAAVEELS
jgi:Zn-dependent M28 family amino/carboxypeptidase